LLAMPALCACFAVLLVLHSRGSAGRSGDLGDDWIDGTPASFLCTRMHAPAFKCWYLLRTDRAAVAAMFRREAAAHGFDVIHDETHGDSSAILARRGAHVVLAVISGTTGSPISTGVASASATLPETVPAGEVLVELDAGRYEPDP
jgi:hypothetical protein